MILVSIRYLKVSIRYRVLAIRRSSHRPVCQYVLAVVDQTRMKPACLFHRKKNKKGVILRPKRKRSDYPRKNAMYISLDLSISPLNFPPFLGIDLFENVSMRYRYPKVLGIGIDPAVMCM